MPVTYIKAKSSLIDNILAHLATTAQSRANHIETFLEEDKHRVELIAESDGIESYVENITRNTSDSSKFIAKANSILNDFMKAENEANELFILNQDGQIIASSNEKNIGINRSADSFLLESMKNTFISDAKYHIASKNSSYTIYTPISDDNTKEFLGVLAANYSFDGLNEITTDRTGLGETGEIYIVNKNDYMITPSRFKEDTFLKQKVDTENARNALLHEDNKSRHVDDIKDITVSLDYRGIPVLGRHVYIEEMQWRILAEVDAEEAFKPLAEMRRFFIIILFVVPIFALLMGIFISRKISGPIEKLSKGAEIIGSGNFDHKVGTDLKDEIGQLSRTFDQMTENLKAVTASRDELNKEIIERKQVEKKLQDSNDLLFNLNVGLDSTAGIVRSLMNRAVEGNDFEVRFENKSLVKCWEVKNCDFESCKSYGMRRTSGAGKFPVHYARVKSRVSLPGSWEIAASVKSIRVPGAILSLTLVRLSMR